MKIEKILKGYGLTLTAAPCEDRDGVDVWVEDEKGNCSSYACASNEGILGAQRYPWEDRNLNARQLAWLQEGTKVLNYLEEVGY